MAKITIAQLQTSDSYISELTAAEMDATKGGLLDNTLAGSSLLNGSNVNVLAVQLQNLTLLNQGESDSGNVVSNDGSGV